GYQTPATSSSSSSNTLINPVTIWNLDQSGRVTDQIISTRATGVSGALTATENFTDQTRWARWTHTYFGNNERALSYKRVYFSIPSSGREASRKTYNETDYGY